MKSGFVVFTQDNCAFCVKAKHLLIEKGFAFEEINVSSLPDDEKQWFKETYKTVPQVFFDTVNIGGFDALNSIFMDPLGEIAFRKWVRPTLLIKRLSPTAIMPTRGSDESIGLDLYADLGIGVEVTIHPNEIVKIQTGWAMTAPEGHYLRVAPRSGLALKGGVDTLAGVVDRDFTGDISVILTTHDHKNMTIKHGDRIAQVIAEKASIVNVLEVASLVSTARGENGWGSTGV